VDTVGYIGEAAIVASGLISAAVLLVTRGRITSRAAVAVAYFVVAPLGMTGFALLGAAALS
jgi:hypothetical protein